MGRPGSWCLLASEFDAASAVFGVYVGTRLLAIGMIEGNTRLRGKKCCPSILGAWVEVGRALKRPLAAVNRPQECRTICGSVATLGRRQGHTGTVRARGMTSSAFCWAEQYADGAPLHDADASSTGAFAIVGV
jgi:hypothetical protein